MNRFALGACCALLLAASSARAQEAGAQEIVRTGAEGSPPAAAPVAAAPMADRSEAARDKAIGDWAQRVLAGAPSTDDDQSQGLKAQAPKGCAALPANDGKPHGEVWAGVGNHGYREIGGVVTQPLGKCGSLTVAVDKTDGNFSRRGRR